MKPPRLMDADDVGILARGVLLAALAAFALLALAGVAGLAWAVFRLAGGL
jgi:hypothetical protein